MSNTKNSALARGSLGRRLIQALSLLILLVIVSPYIVAKTPLRNVLLGRVGAKNDLRLTANSAEFGWLTPMTLRGVVIERGQPSLNVRIKRVQLEQSWFATWVALPDVGRIEITSPEIELTLPGEPIESATPSPPARPIVGEFSVRDATFRLLAARDQGEVIQLANLDLTARIDSDTRGRVLTIEPITLLDRTDLTPDLCDRGLQLVAPVLAKSTAVSGAASLEIVKCSIPLATQEDQESIHRATISGTLQLHHVQTSMKESIFRDVAAVAAGMLQVELPDTMRIADNTEVSFELKDGRVHHEGLSFLLPEISEDMVWTTKGSVGLDDTLDLVVQAQLPFTLAGDGPLASRLAEQPIELHIGGTFDQPKLELPENQNWLRNVAGIATGEDVPGDLQPLADTVIQLLEQARIRRQENEEDGVPTVLDRMRERLQKGREKRRQRTQPDEPPEPDLGDPDGSTSL
ncbi:MAG: hypothetical protein H8E66_16710 [Planctomycetes bacterium]|nr:hypothetical protein [Planctomycetota bacterium]